MEAFSCATFRYKFIKVFKSVRSQVSGLGGTSYKDVKGSKIELEDVLEDILEE